MTFRDLTGTLGITHSKSKKGEGILDNSLLAHLKVKEKKENGNIC